MPDAEFDEKKAKLELYKMEYEQCATSYRNLYDSLWRVFSYLSAVTGAVLVFGRQHLDLGMVLIFSAIPLLLWFGIAYIPLDWYGNAKSERLAEIEKILNEDFDVKLAHFKQIQDSRSNPKKYWLRWRVRNVVHIMALLLLGVMVYVLICGVPLRFKQERGAMQFEGKIEMVSDGLTDQMKKLPEK